MGWQIDQAGTANLTAMRLRTASPSDLALLRYWDTKPHVISATGDDGFLDWENELRRYPDWRELLIAESDGHPIGIIQIIDPAREETHYWGEIDSDLRAIDVWIGEETDLGRGYGTQMMRLALERCFADAAVRAVLLDPLTNNTRAQRFYERLGFKSVGRRMFGNDECLVYRLERQIWRISA
jgi:aminoglycoside 6'-N-acetyltransferase